jgi:hypothetical protein
VDGTKKVPFFYQLKIKYFASVKTINTFARTKKEAKNVLYGGGKII